MDSSKRLSVPIAVRFGPGFHSQIGKPIDRSAYDQYVGVWSRLFVPSALAAAEITGGDRVLDVATGPGEAASLALAQVGSSGLVVGADISMAMLEAAQKRLVDERFLAVVADGQALPFADGTFDAVLCQLGLMFFPDPAKGLREFRRVLRPRRRAAVCVISSPEQAPMWGVLADALGRYLPDKLHVLNLSFSLADAGHLEGLLESAHFREIRLTRETREHSFASFDEYWAPIEAGTGSLPQAYQALPPARRHAVREEVRERLGTFAANGRLTMSLELLIGSGCAS